MSAPPPTRPGHASAAQHQQRDLPLRGLDPLLFDRLGLLPVVWGRR